MNIDFKICWFEDTPEWYEDAKEYVERYIEGFCFIPHIELYDSGDFDINTLKNNEYDLILVDYTLDRSASGLDIINELRKNDIYTEIIFYSSQYDKMKNAVLANDEVLDIIDGVFFSDRDGGDFYKKTEGVIDKLIKRAEEIVNVRGIVLENACDFDKTMEDILVNAIFSFDEKNKERLNKKAKDMVKKSIVGKKNKSERIASSENFVIDLIQDNNSYILESCHKVRLVSKVIEILKSDKRINPVEFDDFSNKYNEEILQVRNMIAHVKYNKEMNAFIGVFNGKKIILSCEITKDIRNNIIKYKKQLEVVRGAIGELQ